MIVEAMYESVPLWIHFGIVVVLGTVAIPFMRGGDIRFRRTFSSFNTPVRDAIKHFVLTVPHSYEDAERYAFRSLHKAMCDGLLPVVGCKREGSRVRRISAKQCRLLEPTIILVPKNPATPQGVMYGLSWDTPPPVPLLETDAALGFTELRVRSSDLYNLFPQNRKDD